VFREKIESGRFVLTCEVLTPVEFDRDRLIEELRPLSDLVDGFNLPFCPLGRLRPHPIATALLIKDGLGSEPILHLAARHQTVLGFEATLLFCHSIGIRSILLVSGDPPREGEGNFRLNSIHLLKIASSLNQGISISRRRIPPTEFLLSAAYNPNRPNIGGEHLRLHRKIEAGARVIFTQPVFDPESFQERIRVIPDQIRVIAGLSFLYEPKIAWRLRKFLGIPHSYITRLSGDETGLLLKTARKIRNSVDGFYIISIGRYDRALELIRRLKAEGIV